MRTSRKRVIHPIKFNTGFVVKEKFPPFSNCPMSELKRVLKSDLKTMMIQNCPPKPLQKLPVCIFNKAYEMFADDAETLQHLPLKAADKKLPDRDFVYDVLQAQHPEYMAEVIGAARRTRLPHKRMKDYQEYFVINEEYRTKLLKYPSKTSKRIPHGKFLF
jgi:hypothetical protein